MNERASTKIEERPSESFLVGGGEMGALMRSIDWSKTPIGPVESWSPALRTVVRVLLANRFPMLLWWGPEYVQLYNDAYRPIPGTKHPRSMGQPASKCWSEIWHVIGPLIDTPFNGGPATWMEDIHLEINRHGFLEETHFTIAYSPVPDETTPRGIGGVLATVHEITEKVIAERRVILLRNLGRAAEAKSAEEACTIAAEILANYPQDIPFALLYLIDPDRQRARLAGAAGIPIGSSASPLVVELAEGSLNSSAWPLSEVVRTEAMQTVEPLQSRFESISSVPSDDAARTAVVMPVHSNKAHELAGLLVAGVSSRLHFNELYRGFLELVSNQVASSIANARAYEDERNRAAALAAIDRAKTTFFSNVSHEFRTPLALMLGPVQDALADSTEALTATQRERLVVARRNSLRLLKLVNTLLDFSRIEAGRVQAVYEASDLSELTIDLASSFRSAIERAGLRLDVDCPPLGEPAYIDRDMWEKIVLNLISNAFKFTLAGNITVALRQEGPTFRLMVRDTGCGIPAGDLPRLFERFHRVESTKGRTHEGTGIGLALVQELVKFHGGSVSVASEVAKGSTFTVIVPAGKDHLPTERIRAERSLASTAIGVTPFIEEAERWLPDPGPGAGGISSIEVESISRIDQIGVSDSHRPHCGPRQRLIVADDNADMREYLRRLLSREYDVVAVGDGEQALRAARRKQPALILADVMMPVLDGFGLLKAIRSDAMLVSVPVVLLSARAGEESTLEGIRAGADDYLIKPFSARELTARIESQIQRKGLERRLAAAEQRLYATLAAARMAAWEWDPQTDMVTASVTAAEVYGLLPGETFQSSTHGFKIVHPEDVERHRALVEAAGARREGFYSEFRIVRPCDGKTAWLEEQSHVTEDPATGRTLITGLVRDVTERKLAEIALRESEERSRFVVRLNDGLRPLSDAEEMSRTAVTILADVLGCDRAIYIEVHDDEDSCTMIGEFSRELPSALGQYRISDYGAEYLTAIRQNRPFVEADTSREGLTPDERSRYKDLQIGAFVAAPLIKGNKLVAIVTVHSVRPRPWQPREVEMVTLVANRCWESIERARVSRALLASEERLAMSVEAAELGTFHCPMPLGPIFWNAKCKEHFWLAPDAEVDFERFYSMLHVEDREQTRLAVKRAVYERQPYDVEYRTVAPDGRVRWIRAKGRAYYDATGSPTRFDGITVDISFRKAVEKRPEEALGAERLAREDAERANRVKDEFLATLSHELRSPLNAILGWSQLLNLGMQDPEDLKKGLEAIERNTRAQTQMIEDLLDMNRIVSGKISLDVQRVFLSDIVEQVALSVKPAAEAKGLRLIKVLDPCAGPVSGDPARLQQVVWNLLTNAIKFTPSAGKIQVVLERANSHLELSVADTGEGIDPAFLPHVFDRFRQADSSTTRKHSGLGLGLSIVKQLAELHGGSVRVESGGKDKGSTFTLVLPVAPVKPTQDEVSAGAVQRYPTSILCPVNIEDLPALHGITILVVDDDPDARGLTKRILSERGATVISEGSATAALDRLKRDHPDLLVSDIGMPGEDGYDLMRKIRSLTAEQGGRIPAVALTAFARSEDRQRALRAGYQMHVAKPVEPSELLTVCASLAGRMR